MAWPAKGRRAAVSPVRLCPSGSRSDLPQFPPPHTSLPLRVSPLGSVHGNLSIVVAQQVIVIGREKTLAPDDSNKSSRCPLSQAEALEPATLIPEWPTKERRMRAGSHANCRCTCTCTCASQSENCTPICGMTAMRARASHRPTCWRRTSRT